MDKKNYRRGVGMIIINNDGRFWLGKRIGTEAWQFPQGGIDKGEDIKIAMYRELLEEVGLKKEEVEYVGESAETIFYDIPKTIRSKVLGGKFKGQEQKWFLLKLKKFRTN